MGWFLQQAIELPHPHSVRVWKWLATEYLANVIEARNEKQRGTVEWVKLEAMRQVYAHLLKRWVIPPGEFLDRLFQDLR